MNRLKNYLLRNTFLHNLYDDYCIKRDTHLYTPSFHPTHILDLGAHKGFVTKYYAERYPWAVIHAYEPNWKLCRSLDSDTHDRVWTFNEAIAPHIGYTTLDVSPRHVSSRLDAKGGQPVRCTTFREAVERMDAPKVFVKMDIEGGELWALEDIPEEVVEIIGEVHGDYVTVCKMLSKRFPWVDVPSDKGIFHARDGRP